MQLPLNQLPEEHDFSHEHVDASKGGPVVISDPEAIRSVFVNTQITTQIARVLSYSHAKHAEGTAGHAMRLWAVLMQAHCGGVFTPPPPPPPLAGGGPYLSSQANQNVGWPEERIRRVRSVSAADDTRPTNQEYLAITAGVLHCLAGFLLLPQRHSCCRFVLKGASVPRTLPALVLCCVRAFSCLRSLTRPFTRIEEPAR